jgi:non-ribosomal peptide synthetase component E (peptide arylation enzyme)
MLPDEIHIVESLPMTPQGKVDRRRLLAANGRTAWEGQAL